MKCITVRKVFEKQNIIIHTSNMLQSCTVFLQHGTPICGVKMFDSTKWPIVLVRKVKGIFMWIIMFYFQNIFPQPYGFNWKRLHTPFQQTKSPDQKATQYSIQSHLQFQTPSNTMNPSFGTCVLLNSKLSLIPPLSNVYLNFNRFQIDC